MILADLATARSGDKGDTCNIAVFVQTDADWQRLAADLTPARVKAHFADLVKGEVRRYDLPQLRAFNFVLHQALDGGATRSLRVDTLGKTLGAALLRLELPPTASSPNPIPK